MGINKPHTKCVVRNCNHSNFENDKCVFHCEKSNWYGLKGDIKSWKLELVDEFWIQFNLWIQRLDGHENIIFPITSYHYKEHINSDKVVAKTPFFNRTLEGKCFKNSKFLDGLVILNCVLERCDFSFCDIGYFEIIDSDITNCDFKYSKFERGLLDCIRKSHGTDFQWIESSLFIIQNSTIKNIYCSNSYFKRFDIIQSSVVDSFFQNIKVGKGSIDTFRIIKQYNEKNADNTNAYAFYARELRELMNVRLKEFLNNFKSFKLFFSEGLLLAWNYIISYFGQNWILPVFWFFLSSIIIYYIIGSETPSSINEFSMFISPFLKNIETKYKGFYALWLSHKILSGIFIYHFIVAVKRKTKK